MRLILVLLLGVLPLFGSEDAIFREDFEGDSRPDWKGAEWDLCPGVTGRGIRITNPPGTDRRDARIMIPMDLQKLAGKKVLLSAMVRGEKITAKPKPYLGGKLMLIVTREGGPTGYHQADIETGTFDWLPVFSTISIPSDARSVALCLGLEGVKGSILFDNILIEPGSEAKVKALTSLALKMGDVPLVAAKWNAVLRVDTKPGAPVNPLVFGDNIEAFDDAKAYENPKLPARMGRTGAGIWNPSTHAMREDVGDILREVGVRVLRYPGGTLAKGFQWKKATGPREDRPDLLYGLDEYLTSCRLLGALPVITVAEYVGTAKDAADLVEYLNAPADDAHPWARKRAENGHPEPWGVRYFELGNESYMGYPKVKPFREWTAAEYGDYAVAYSRAMKAVDPTIRIGAVTHIDDKWTDTVLEKVKQDADFIIDHFYPCWLDQGKLSAEFPNRVMRAVLASTQDLEEYLLERRGRICRITGRDLPMAITEYNGGFVNQTPVPYRYSLGAALFAADFRRVMQKPECNVLMANYWQAVTGFWGMIYADDPAAIMTGTPTTWRKLPAYYFFRLWANHCGTHQLAVNLEGPKEPFEGFLGVAARGGESGKPPFEPLTAFASASANRKTVHLLVFNKHAINDVETEVILDGLPVASAKAWVVTGPSLDACNEKDKPEAVTETVSAASLPLTNGTVQYRFPARSMTALDLEIQLPASENSRAH